MDSGQALQGLIVIGLLALSAFFSSAETAMMTVNKIRVRNLAEAGLSHAVVLEKISVSYTHLTLPTIRLV